MRCVLPVLISIHALLAESDASAVIHKITRCDFYPRSPCGERQFQMLLQAHHNQFLSTLSLRRATDWPPVRDIIQWISIHALLAESDFPTLHNILKLFPFLSTLSLRRATMLSCMIGPPFVFLSTLSLRRATEKVNNFAYTDSISIHALLAESDR